ncbi:hypothetical protein [Calidithermus chliarophilus]|uniref:hypothetical protein n=1 Tax=Calidithermus chliarophilus TaxID=52023 RepID=UPI000407491D|nr:hypothetical protein [Calidithermus chliarophilus]
MAGLNLTLQGCSLSGDTLNCTVEVANPQGKAVSLSIAPASVQALTASGWLYQGQASAGSLRLGPGGKTTLRLSFRGVDNPSGLFAMIQVGEARFLGVAVPGAPRLAARDGYCFYFDSMSFQEDGRFVCHLTVANDTDTDLKLRLDPGQSFVVTELGSRYLGTRVVLGERWHDYGSPVDLTVPARTTTRLGVVFEEARFGQQNYPLQKVQLIRFKVGGGFLELRDAPVRYCGAEANKKCGSSQPF